MVCCVATCDVQVASLLGLEPAECERPEFPLVMSGAASLPGTNAVRNVSYDMRSATVVRQMYGWHSVAPHPPCAPMRAMHTLAPVGVQRDQTGCFRNPVSCRIRTVPVRRQALSRTRRATAGTNSGSGRVS
jgi:hypothetical protein